MTCAQRWGNDEPRQVRPCPPDIFLELPVGFHA